jgi:Icc protein
MRIVDATFGVLADLPYLRARSGGGTEVARLELQEARVDHLPEGLDAVLVASDLQGMAPSRWAGEAVLLGCALAEQLPDWHDQALLPSPARLGVVLAGDLFSAPAADKRGATGDVRAVWDAFDQAGCARVCGVAGNHDTFGRSSRRPRELLDGDVVEWGGLRLAGVSGVIGHKDKPGRRPPAVFGELVRRALAQAPDVLVLHQGPPGLGRRQSGEAMISEMLGDFAGLVVCGHVHWNEPLAERGAGQVLNVDGRAVLLHT